MSTRISPRRLLSLALITGSVTALASVGSSPAARSITTAGSRTITATRFAQQADVICATSYKQQAALGSPLVNADKVTIVDLPKAANYLDKIAAITKTELTGISGLAPTAEGMPARAATVAAEDTILNDEQRAASAAHKGDLARFKAAFNRFILHGYPTGPDYRKFVASATTLERTFPFKVCGKGSNIYP